jgi:ergothioneine biosynthesis protein EgtB
MSPLINRDEIESRMRESRRQTLELFDIVIDEADLRRPPAEGFRPILWHMGHVGAFEEYWILQKIKGDPPVSERYNAIFDPIKTPREDSKNLPPIPEIKAYLERVSEKVFNFLREINTDHHLLRNGYLFNMLIEHDYQHQETLCYLLQLLEPELKRRPQSNSEITAENQSPLQASGDMVSVEGGEFEMGSNGYPFAYDNEQPPHIIELADFRIGRFPVTNGAFLEFVEAGGYKKQSLWSEEGWAWKQENLVESPIYWLKSQNASESSNNGWRIQEMFEERALPLDHPVTGVSWHEAEAYARFVGKRLATEAEWEKAASWNPESGSKSRFSWGDSIPQSDIANFSMHHWGTAPVTAFPEGRSAYGCFDMTGNVWEWTSTIFAGYPGFEAYPYKEYSELWFDGDHRVLKGGSWATRLPILRCSFRNFFRPGFRIAFAGFRCAAD